MLLSGPVHAVIVFVVIFVTVKLYQEVLVKKSERRVALGLFNSRIQKLYDHELATRSVELCAAVYCPREELLKRNYTGAVASFQPWRTVIDDTLGTVGLIGHMEGAHRTVFVVFRGTDNVQNWIENLDIVRASYPPCDGCEVHQGFLLSHDAIIDQVIRTLKHYPVPIDNTTDIVVTGHSSGAGLATLVSVSLKRRLGLVRQRVHLITFGSPRVGNPKAAAFISSLFSGDTTSQSSDPSSVLPAEIVRRLGDITTGGTTDPAVASHSYRFTHRRDAVVHTPLTIYGYRHITTEYYEGDSGHVRQCSGAEDPTCSDEWVVLSITDHMRYLGIHMGCSDPVPAVRTGALSPQGKTGDAAAVDEKRKKNMKYGLPLEEGDNKNGREGYFGSFPVAATYTATTATTTTPIGAGTSNITSTATSNRNHLRHREAAAPAAGSSARSLKSLQQRAAKTGGGLGDFYFLNIDR